MPATSARTVLAFVVLAASCASGHTQSAQGSPAPEEAVVLEVANHMWTDADVYIIVSNVSRHIGNVVSQETVKLPLPSDVVASGSMQVRIDPLGGGNPYVTDRIEIGPGQHVLLTVEHQTGLSTWIIERANRW